VEFPQLLAEGRRLVLDIAGRQEFSSRNRLDGSAHQNTVHGNVVADAKASHGEFVFGGNMVGDGVSLASEFNSLAGFQVGESNQNVVAGIELEHAEMHRSQDVTEFANAFGYCKTLVVRSIGMFRECLNLPVLTDGRSGFAPGTAEGGYPHRRIFPN
jgi:hypothetical protein